MLEQLPSPSHVVALRVTGKVDEADVARGIQAVEAALAANERIALYSEIEMSGISGGAFLQDLGYSLGKLRELHRFSRVAVVTGQGWLRTIVEIESRLLPQIAFRIFAPAEREEAMAWASQPAATPEAPPPEPPGPAIRIIATDKPNVMAYELDGRIGAQDMQLLVGEMNRAMQALQGTGARLRIFVRVRRFAGISLEALRHESLPSLKMEALRQGERCAIVGGPDWVRTTAQWTAPLVPLATRHFDLADESSAWDWIEARPVGTASDIAQT